MKKTAPRRSAVKRVAPHHTAQRHISVARNVTSFPTSVSQPRFVVARSSASLPFIIPNFSPFTTGQRRFAADALNAYQRDPKEIQDRIVQVLKTFSNVKADKLADPNVAFTDLGLDSLDRVEVMIAIEEEFNIEFSDEQSDKFASVDQVVDVIARKPDVVLRNFKPDDV